MLNESNIKSLPVYHDTIIYVPCPAAHATGGTEILHQFVHQLRKRNIDARLFYYRSKKGTNPVHPRFAVYEPVYATEIENNAKHILVVPETRTEYLYRYPAIRKVIWWLSVDFFYDTADVDRWSTLLKMTGITKRFNLQKPEKLPINLHLVQSRYAALHLERHGIHNYTRLSDYLNASFFANRLADKPRENRILYNPLKGWEFTKQLIEHAPELNWAPLINLTPQEVAALCQTSKVYIDFGQHPGKDRFPREAAISRCCIITGKRGAAANDQDIPIPASYKFNDVKEDIPAILEQIRYCFNNYDSATRDFDHYRDSIRRQEAEFNNDLEQIFVPASVPAI
ncbi:hypothetical protein [Filimonas effusa]|uniref:Glycosyltransferase family 1 protein n=1 Tax=Filimonas effusa TaxID=2508721 RepID=A0A4Q1D1W7_9BACT|nr:hypothetical protein [Filimonas effusa]RXK81866.1 hypothetical protein ESB13_18945 [Filimonas effusa]